MIQFDCACGKRLQAQEQYAGMAVGCPACGASVTIPDVGRAIQPAMAPLPPTAPPYGAGPPPMRQPYGAPPPAARQTIPLCGKALTSLILGVLTFLLPVLLAIPAIILGVLALRDIRQSGGRLSGRGMALAGVITGAAGNISLLPFWFIWNSISESQDKAVSRNNIHQMGLAMHTYHDVMKKLPTHAIYSKDGKPLLSWRVAILPYVEEQNLYQRFRLDEPWDSPNNLPLLSQMPRIYAPVRGTTPEPFSTYYQVFTGSNTPFKGPLPMKITQFTDGTSNTILIAEAGEAVPWTKPADMEVKQFQPLPRLGGQWRSGCWVAMGDGSVRWIDPRRISEQTLRWAIDPNDGMPLPGDWDQ